MESSDPAPQSAPITTVLVPATPLTEHPFSAAKIPPRKGHVRIHDSHGTSHDLPVENIAAAQKIDPDLRLDLSNVPGFHVIGKVVDATETHPVPRKKHATPQNRSTITIEPNSQSPKTGIVDKPSGRVILPPLPTLEQA